MPIYEYQCEKCGHVFEVQQSFNDEPVKTCNQPKCSGKVKKLFSPPAIIFKGKGFYCTDYGRGNLGSKSAGSSSEKSEACKSCESGTCAKSD
jgi:putative FmdB family regulatory protein